MIACLQEGPYRIPDLSVLGLRPQLQRLAYEDCTDPVLKASAIWMGGTPVVIICPRFFTFPLQLEEGRTCLAVDRATNNFVGDGGGVHLTRVYVLLHELVHVYLGGLLSRTRMGKEAYIVQDCWNLSGGRARVNPSSYGYYVNSVLCCCLFLCIS